MGIEYSEANLKNLFSKIFSFSIPCLIISINSLSGKYFLNKLIILSNLSIWSEII